MLSSLAGALTLTARVGGATSRRRSLNLEAGRAEKAAETSNYVVDGSGVSGGS